MQEISKTEEKILEVWEKNKIFEKSLEIRDKNKPYVFYDGPPFATGLPHYGHILASTIKDVIPRYFTMRGYYARRRWGWDCHGLPIENIIEKNLKISGKKQIEKIGVDVFNKACRETVLKYADQWGKMVKRIGRWIEFENSYKTMESSYMESVWWAVKQIWDKGLIYQGRRVLLYCPRCETPISNFEVAMDQSYRDLKEETITVKFKAKNPEKYNLPKNTYFLAWTTTPWTLPGNVALAICGDIDYILVKQGKENYILAEARQGALKGNYHLIKKIKGKDLAGLEYEPLFEIESIKKTDAKSHYVAAADFVSTEEGTGLVHIAPVYGEDDYNLGLKLGLTVVPLLNEQGVFNKKAPKFIQGKYFEEAEEPIKNDLEKRGLLYKKEEMAHSYPLCWRCETKLFYNAIPAWFINIQKIKRRLLELNEKINWYPAHLKQGRFKKGIESAPDWNISRNRYWATALPIWQCENRKCEHKICLGSFKELKEKAINYKQVYQSERLEEVDLHKPYIDAIKLKCAKCGKAMSRIQEVIDCWVESGSMPFAELHYPFENKELFKKRLPAQFVAEYTSQTRAWFYVMHAVSTIIFDKAPFENVVATGNILNEKGEKLSKSKRNFPDPWGLIEKYGVDALRYYLMSSALMKADDLFFKESEVDEVYKKVILIISNVLSFYKMFEEGTGKRLLPERSRRHTLSQKNILDKWILARLHELIKKTTESMDKYNVVSGARPIGEFIQDLSVWYLRRSRERIKSEDKKDKEQALAALRYSLLELSKIMAPITPFIAEHLYKNTGGKKESVHLENWPKYDKNYIDSPVLENMKTARGIVSLALEKRAAAGIPVRQPLNLLIIYGQKLSDDFVVLIKDEVNIKKVEFKKQKKELRVELDTKITEKLKKEGIYRELVRQINDLRKKAGLTIKDNILLYFETDSNLILSAIKNFEKELKKAVIATQIKREKRETQENKELQIQNEKIWLGIDKSQRSEE